MAKVLISVNNSTNKVVSIHLRSSSMSPSRQHFTFGDGATQFPKDGVNIPDNCDPARYFDTERLEVVIGDSHEFSLWVDDGDNFRIRQCEGNKWRQSEYLVGGDTGGDGALVSLHIGCDSHGKYHLKAVNVTAHPQASLFAKGLHVLNLIYLGLPKQAGDQNTTLAATMQTEEFKTLAGIANEYGFKSIGLVVGVDAALVIGFETMAGLITGTLAQEELLLLDSTGVSVSLEIGRAHV